MYSFSAAEGA
jgi:acyl dehydratase